MSDKKVVPQSIFNQYDSEMQATLIAQGFTVVMDEPVTPAFPADNKNKPVVDIMGEDSDADEDEDSGLFINIFVTKGDKRFKLTFASLDSDFTKYTDKEHTTKNMVREAIVDAVNTHGFEAAVAKINFSVELTKKGETSVIDLMS